MDVKDLKNFAWENFFTFIISENAPILKEKSAILSVFLDQQ